MADPDDLERRIDDLEHELMTAEDERNEAVKQLEALVRGMEESGDLSEAIERASEILGYGPVGTYWPSWTHNS